MAKITSLASLLLAAAVLACAAASRSAAPPGSPEAVGEGLYRAHCGACHRLRDPGEQTRERWAWAVEHYGPRAHLAAEDRPPVLAYLQAHAKDAPAASGGSR